jgi:hypothetical protein
VLYLRQIASPSNRIPKYVSIFIYPPSFLRFTIMYSHRDTRFFIDEFRLKIHRKNRHPKVFSHRSCNVANSKKQRNAVSIGCEFTFCERKINLVKQECKVKIVISTKSLV